LRRDPRLPGWAARLAAPAHPDGAAVLGELRKVAVHGAGGAASWCRIPPCAYTEGLCPMRGVDKTAVAKYMRFAWSLFK
jgi:hypothetical protein